MKKQNFNKKLVLKKGIISNLNMSKAKGGAKLNATYEIVTCDCTAPTETSCTM